MTSGTLYCPFWCEENVWHLAGEARFAGRPAWVVPIAAPGGACPLWAQRAAPPDQPVFWDYHVVLFAEGEGGVEVWDLDTRLGMPVPLARYLDVTFAGSEALDRAWRPRFRVVPGAEYRARFASDRAHMRDASGRWRQPPPAWPPIRPDEPGTLARFIDMDARFVGEVLDLPGLRARFA
jgi:hypothetical protein